MISFNYETNFELPYEQEYSSWISKVITSENCNEGEINYIFCDDDYLLDINIKYLNHDTFTDIISFDYSVGKELHGDIYISIDRVKENAKDFEVHFKDEIRRVMVHGVLHYCGYKDKSEHDQELMRSKEDFYISQWS
ncbi:rRNA maturation RNase YbeY [Psychroserpens mesophilus]|uniref:rRNA maturation RNase YbeY n=1 Tax=Psychroserpens mesophilus TaxID=325473 RepID=UPI003D64EF4F